MSSQKGAPHLDPSPRSIDTVLTEQKGHYDDCMSCRLMGSAAFTGMGFYTWYSGRQQLKERELEILRSGSRFGIGARKFGILGMSALLVGMGAWRQRN